MADSKRKKLLDSILKAAVAAAEVSPLLKFGTTFAAELSARFGDLPEKDQEVLGDVTHEDIASSLQQIDFAARYSAMGASGTRRIESMVQSVRSELERQSTLNNEFRNFAEKLGASIPTILGLLTSVAQGVNTLVERSDAERIDLKNKRDQEQQRSAQEESKRIEDYCDWLCSTHRAFEGIFQELPAALDNVAITLDVVKDRAPSDSEAFKIRQRVLADSPTDKMTFAQLLKADWRWWTLGGEPGAGKTTTLRLHARKVARDRSRNAIPVYLPLASWLEEIGDGTNHDLQRAFGDSQGLVRWFARYLEYQSDVPGLAQLLMRHGEAGELLIFLDGYDELSPNDRERLIGPGKILDILYAKWGKCRVIVATRRYQSAKRLDQDRFGDANMCPLTHSDAIGLLRRILALYTESQARANEHLNWFREQLVHGPRLWREIARRPLLVSLLGLQLIEDREPSTSRLEFFETAFDVLCDGRHRRNTKPLPGRTRKALLLVLRFLAWRMTVSRQRFGNVQKLEGWLSSSASDTEHLRPPIDVVDALGSNEHWSDAKSLLRSEGAAQGPP